MPVPKQDPPDGFLSPTESPRDERQAASWQSANRRWWEANPMRYDWTEAHQSPHLTREFFEEIDRRFFASAREFLPWNSVPFDTLIDFEAIRGQRVLEIGVGMGSHAQLLAAHAQSFVGIDLTAQAVTATRARLRHSGLPGEVLQVDAERMAFADESFAWIWSWGVIHHSSDTRRILAEIERTLVPGGKAVLMVYHRSWWRLYVLAGLFHGLLGGEYYKSGSVHAVLQRTTDGALARFYTVPEWRELLERAGLICERIMVCGQKAEMVPLPSGALKSMLLRMLPAALARFFTNRLRLGSFLVATARKP